MTIPTARSAAERWFGERTARGGAAHAEGLAAGVIDKAFWRAVALIIVFFVMLALYRVFSARFDRRAGAK